MPPPDRTDEPSLSIPDAFPTMPTDRFVSAYFSPKCDIMLQIELQFPDRLDRDILRRALDLALDAEPVLGCRFSIEEGRVVWRRLERGARDNFRELNSEAEYVRYKNQTIDPQKGPSLFGGVLTGGSGDRLLLKIAHEACDAGGAKEVAYLVASLYRQLRTDPGYRPVPNTAGSRGLDQVLQHVPWYAYPRQWMNFYREALSIILRPRAFCPFTAEVTDLAREYVTREISADTVFRLKAYGSRANAKLNDILLTAFIRAFSHTGWDGTAQLRCAWTIDFRKWYLPGGKAGSIANLSGIEIVNLGTDRGRTFGDTLRKVAAATEERKRNWIGLSHFPGMFRMLENAHYDRMRSFFVRRQEGDIRAGRVFPAITNLGPIDEEQLRFETTPSQAQVMVPAVLPPFFGIGVSGYREGLTVSAAAYPGTGNRVNGILDAMMEEVLTLGPPTAAR